MKRLIVLLIAIAMVIGLYAQAQAALILRGADSLGHRLIYDNDLNITWYDYSNRNTWQNQVNWASNLTVNFNGTTYDDWRLPTTVAGLYVWGYDGTTTAGYNITSSELGHLYYSELGNKGYYGINGAFQPGWGLTSTGDFEHLIATFYWSGTEYSAYSGIAWLFSTYNGLQALYNKSLSYYAIAVRDGDVAGSPVPEPSTFILFGAGLAGVAAFRKRFKK